MHRHIVIGPPGTGKTTFLKNKVTELVKIIFVYRLRLVTLVLLLKQQKKLEIVLRKEVT